MRRKQTRKLLRISTFLAVSLGLAMGTSVAAAPPADDDAPLQWAEYEEGADERADEDEAMVGEEEMVELREGVDFPGDIQDFAEFIRDHQEEGIEDVPEYTHEGAENMADAMEEVIPGESGLFQDRPEEYQAFEDQLDEWEDRVDELSDTERDDFAQLATDVLNEGAQWLTSLQEQAYPDLGDQVQEVQTAADEIDGETDINEQAEQIEQYFVASLDTIEEMYVAHEEDPLAGAPTITPVVNTETQLAQADDHHDEHHDEPGMEDDPMMEDDPAAEDDPMMEEPEMAEAVRNYIDHVEGLEEADFEGEDGEQNVVTSFNYLEEALGNYIEEDEPALEPAQYDGMEDEPGMEDDPMMEEEPADELTQHHEELRNNIDQLEENIGQEEFSEYLNETVNTATELFTGIQTEQFPEFADAAQEVRDAAMEIEDDIDLDEQAGELLTFFEANKDALEAMEEEPEPVTLLF